MIFKKLAIALSVIFLSMSVQAHEGHDSAMVKSLHGGMVKKSTSTYVEVLQDEKVEIFVTSHDYKNLVNPSFQITAMAEVKGKKIPLKLEIKKDNVLVLTDLKQEKHFKLNILMKINGKEEAVSFPLEN